MKRKLTKKESLELLRKWAIDRIVNFGVWEYETLTDEERADMQKAKEFLIFRLGITDPNAVHTAEQKLDSRLP